VFAENMDSMHSLSLLLTADLAKAEECFVSGLEDCVEGTLVFRDRAQSRSKAQMRAAIGLLAARASVWLGLPTQQRGPVGAWR
jgi:hypothetical protein